MFRAADAMLVTKTDLLRVIDDFDTTRAMTYFRNLANRAPVYSLSCKTGEGMQAWTDWLREQIAAQRQRVAAGITARPKMQSDGSRLHQP